MTSHSTIKRSVLITGGSVGIGAAMVETLAQSGHAVAFTYLTHADEAQSLVTGLTKHGHTVRAFQSDLSDPKAPPLLHQAVTDWAGTIHVLINNVGPGRATPLAPNLGQDAVAMMQLGIGAALDLTALCAPDMTDGDVILNISSLNGRMPPSNVSAFAASKAALDAATLALALELGPRGIRVLGIAPGPIERADAPRPDDVRDKIRSKTALPRFGTPQDVADLAAFCVSDKAGFLTGEIIGLHGGWH